MKKFTGAYAKKITTVYIMIAVGAFACTSEVRADALDEIMPSLPKSGYCKTFVQEVVPHINSRHREKIGRFLTDAVEDRSSSKACRRVSRLRVERIGRTPRIDESHPDYSLSGRVVLEQWWGWARRCASNICQRSGRQTTGRKEAKRRPPRGNEPAPTPRTITAAERIFKSDVIEFSTNYGKCGHFLVTCKSKYGSKRLGKNIKGIRNMYASILFNLRLIDNKKIEKNIEDSIYVYAERGLNWYKNSHKTCNDDSIKKLNNFCKNTENFHGNKVAHSFYNLLEETCNSKYQRNFCDDWLADLGWITPKKSPIFADEPAPRR